MASPILSYFDLLDQLNLRARSQILKKLAKGLSWLLRTKLINVGKNFQSYGSQVVYLGTKLSVTNAYLGISIT
jgi:hypothetical protein